MHVIGAYEWPVLLAVKYMLLIYLNIGFLIAVFTAGMVQSKPMAVQLVNYIHLTLHGCGLELILAVYREVHAHSFILNASSMCNILAPWNGRPRYMHLAFD